MIRVTDLERSIAFYTGVLGMQLLRREEAPDSRYTLAFVGYGPESEGAVIELTYNWDTNHYDIGDGFGHIALGVEDIHTACAEIRSRGGEIAREPGPMCRGGPVLAYVRDPDGYMIELLERA